ncbi:MAG: TPM domain-containing protein [Clostridia bacterium]|nr:TPM domain-containing protein [Clostridia bacterium]
MKQKRLFVLLISLVLCVISVLPVSAAYPYLVDNADILSDREESELLSELTKISREYGVNLAVVTVESLDGSSIESYANDFYDTNYGAKADGVMLLLSMEEREYWLLTEGFGTTAIPSKRIDYITDRFVSDLSDGYYASAFSTYAELCEEHFEKAANGEAYSETEFSFQYVLIGFAIGAVIAFIIVSIMKSQLKTVRMQPMARSYIRDGSFVLTREHDRFLYRNVTKRAKPKDNNSSGGSKSGGSRGGGGGKF